MPTRDHESEIEAELNEVFFFKEFTVIFTVILTLLLWWQNSEHWLVEDSRRAVALFGCDTNMSSLQNKTYMYSSPGR